MKLNELKQKLRNQFPDKISSVRSEYIKAQNKFEDTKIDEMKQEQKLDHQELDVNTYQRNGKLLDSIPYMVQIEEEDEVTFKGTLDNKKEPKIIGITGSRGKSTVAYIVHQALKASGYKSILYSSICVDSPVSYKVVNESCEVPLYSEAGLLEIIEEAEAYEANYIVLEINESTIAKGLVKDIPFHIRALTHLDPKHNEELYTEAEYVRIKKSFFQNIVEEDCICVLGLTGPLSREEFNQVLQLNENPKITFGSKYICEKRNADYRNLDCLLHGMEHSLDGLEIQLRVENESLNISTSVMLPHNALNITCAISILVGLKVFEKETFKQCMKELRIPGREEVIHSNGRKIIIGLSVVPALEVFDKYQSKGEVENIKVVIGSTGTGYIHWDKVYKSERFVSSRSDMRKFACQYVKQHADQVYLTSNDNGADSAYEIALEMQSYINKEIPSVIEVDRKQAIKRAMMESNLGDIIYIAGRGNRKLFCNGENTVHLFNDKDTVLEIIKELGW